METIFEIVRVLDDRSLVNSESYQCDYSVPHGDVLEPGYYVVTRDSPEALMNYDANAHFFGPCGSRAEAEAFVERANGASPTLH
jgi:hypothetical protein